MHRNLGSTEASIQIRESLADRIDVTTETFAIGIDGWLLRFLGSDHLVGWTRGEGLATKLRTPRQKEQKRKRHWLPWHS